MPDRRALPPALPFIPAPCAGELLSSWLRRVAAEYHIDVAQLIQHIGLSIASTSMLDRSLSTNDVTRAAIILRATPADLRAMMHAPAIKALKPSRSLLQVCLTCRADHRARSGVPMTVRAWFHFWSIECDRCRTPFSPPGPPQLDRINPAREEPLWFEDTRDAARAGARRLADFARRPFMTGWSPLILLRLLSMRFDAASFRNATWFSSMVGCRVAELFVPGLAGLRSANLIPEPWTMARPVRLVTARTILLAAMDAAFNNRLATVDLLWSVAPDVRNREFRPLVIGLNRFTPESHCYQLTWDK